VEERLDEASGSRAEHSLANLLAEEVLRGGGQVVDPACVGFQPASWAAMACASLLRIARLVSTCPATAGLSRGIGTKRCHAVAEREDLVQAAGHLGLVVFAGRKFESADTVLRLLETRGIEFVRALADEFREH